MTILGAGVAGCAIAYYLAREGVKVRVIEREAVGSCASGYALGVLHPLAGEYISGATQPMAMAAFRMHRELWPVLEDEADMDIQARAMSHLELCMTDDEIANGQEEMRRWGKAEGFASRWLEPADVRNLEPRLTHQLVGAVLLEDVGVLDSYRYTLALAKAAELHGAEFSHEDAIGLRAVGDRVAAVTLSHGEIACGTVVVALGPWSGQVAGWLRLDVPVEPVKGQILHLEGLDPPLEHHVSGPHSIVHKLDGLVWIGATYEHTGFDNSTSDDARDSLIRQALSMIPALGDLSLVRQTACLRPVAPDRQPILGKAPGWDGVYLATGAEKKGILLSPAIGRAVADLIISGETPLPIAPFAPGRFLS